MGIRDQSAVAQLVDQPSSRKVAGANAGFFLPDTTMLSPDASYVLPETIRNAGENGMEGIPYICPNFVIELRSKSEWPAQIPGQDEGRDRQRDRPGLADRSVQAQGSSSIVQALTPSS
jgi:hypothetical protein